MTSQSDNTSKDQTPTLDDIFIDFAMEYANPDSKKSSAECLSDIKQAVYAALVEQKITVSEAATQSPRGETVIHKVEAIPLSVLSAVLGVTKEEI